LTEKFRKFHFHDRANISTKSCFAALFEKVIRGEKPFCYSRKSLDEIIEIYIKENEYSILIKDYLKQACLRLSSKKNRILDV